MMCPPPALSPRKPMWSVRRVSIVTRRTLGWRRWAMTAGATLGAGTALVVRSASGEVNGPGAARLSPVPTAQAGSRLAAAPSASSAARRVDAGTTIRRQYQADTAPPDVRHLSCWWRCVTCRNWLSVTRCAVVDIGSNSIHLLIAERERLSSGSAAGYRIRRIESPATLLGLGRVVAASGRLDEGAARELSRTVARQVKQAERAKVSELHVVATAAVRQAANGRERMAALCREIGAPIRILTARREAELGFIGLVDDLDPALEQVTIDGGGASTEVSIAHGRRRGAAVSLPVGVSVLWVSGAVLPILAWLSGLRRSVDDRMSV